MDTPVPFTSLWELGSHVARARLTRPRVGELETNPMKGLLENIRSRTRSPPLSRSVGATGARRSSNYRQRQGNNGTQTMVSENAMCVDSSGQRKGGRSVW